MHQLANALCQEKLCESSKIRIFWPRERCSLLRDDVVFVDSPGVDVSPNLDDWIDNHCLDADVFVLVLNAESTMTLAVSLLKQLNIFSNQKLNQNKKKKPQICWNRYRKSHSSIQYRNVYLNQMCLY